MRGVLQTMWTEPRAPDPPKRVWWDWALVAVLAVSAVLEGLLREDVAWRPVALILGVTLAFPLLWRRSHPLAVVVVVFSPLVVVDIAVLFSSQTSVGLYTMAYLLMLPYSLTRWGSGRERVIGLALIVSTFSLAIAADYTGIADAVIGGVFLLFPAVLGAAVRYRANSRLRETEQVRLLEREQLARELHDTVAHHVSAIAIQAQAGRTLAPSNPDAALDALAVVEEEASRTLAEMRTMVGALRQGEEPDLAPLGSLADIERLAHSVRDQPSVEVEISGDLDDLQPSVEAALFRLAQESITNAVRHARHATLVNVSVADEGHDVRLTVRDDGKAADVNSSPGYGLIGMAERAKLLGGTLEAGPNPDRGWTITAVIPKEGTGA